MSEKTYKVIIEQELEITIDMDKYTKESIEQYEDYWGYEFDNKEDTIKEIVTHIVYNYRRDGYFDQNAEGLVFEGFTGKDIGTNINVSEK